MATWENFENKCTEYLVTAFGNKADFIHQGKSDSTVPDILVSTKGGKNFYIEAKHCPAQCGQFVLIPNIARQSFDYSNLNVTPINDNAKQIINHMNNDFEAFKESGTKGKEIIMANGPVIFSSWIVDYYRSKNVKYFITNDNIILPIDKFANYFAPKAMYRVKRSGSGSVGKTNIAKVLSYIKSAYDIQGYTDEGPKLFITTEKNMHNTRFILDNNEYMFSIRGNVYETRKLSNTFNANVIFSISLKASQNSSDLSAFEDELL